MVTLVIRELKNNILDQEKSMEIYHKCKVLSVVSGVCE